MKKITYFVLSVVVGVFVTSCSLFGYRSEEEPNYTVVVKEDKNEIRVYKTYIVAKTTIVGSFKDIQGKGFKILANYIFGDNKSRSKIEMTAPVTLESDLSKKSKNLNNETILMTAPVILSPMDSTTDSGLESWTMSFTMPSSYNMENLPLPNDERVILEEVSSKTFAVVRFTGFWNAAKVKSKGNELLKWILKGNKYEQISEPMFAGYDPPWTLPFFRRNEVWIELKSKDNN